MCRVAGVVARRVLGACALGTPLPQWPDAHALHAAPPAACRQSFKEHEALVYHQLTNLIRDTVWLKSYLSAGARWWCAGVWC